ncbi:uncharacterized protein N7483_005403 [Penicillium malachiteum]|uniref:uncharacterized protein n=1 Tax=Penicillium malachiteum TaxID=1324776 RepID=UPI0025494ED4|nr:uncharacterized protein N7483_005403 [Penicillium malachiteum]KAJ5730895.1 hypothetical protein N7483_005403 [Penicillium malachiteum]
MPWPHTIATCAADVTVSDIESGLTTHLKAIVELITGRVFHEELGLRTVYPLLMLSFMGPQQGRIIQVSCNGWEIHVQCSQLWSFRHEKTAPLEMFIRYFIATPVQRRIVPIKMISTSKMKSTNTSSGYR